MNPNTERDGNVIHNLFAEFHYADDLGVIKSKLAEYVTTVRKKARAAVFKEAIGMVATLPTQETMNYRRGYEEGVRDAIRTIEAAANTEEGGGDG